VKRKFCTLLALLIITSLSWAEEIIPASSVEELETRLLDILATNNTPGLIGAIVDGNKLPAGDVIWQGALGTANRKTGQPVTADTLFRVGSISKSFVSLSILKLVERKTLSLDLVVHETVPEAGVTNPWRREDPIKLFHLLEHTAGFDDIHLRDYAFSDPDVTLLAGIEFNTSSRVARWPPGTRMSYSNMGPPVAALVLEKITGERFEDFVDREIFDVLGMNTATFFFDDAVAASYRDDGETVQSYVHIPVRPSGALNATSSDMIQLLRMYIGRGELNGHVLIKPESLERMETTTSTLAAKNGLQSGYGLGNYTTQKNGFIFQGHDGGVDGFISKYVYLRKQKLGYFFSLNAGNGQTYKSIDDEIAAFATRELEPETPVPTIHLSANELDSFTGYYQPDSPRMELTRGLETLMGVIAVEAQDGKLMIGSPFGEKETWYPVSNSTFLKEGEVIPSLIFVQSASDRQLMQGGGGTSKKITPFYTYIRWMFSAYTVLLMISALLFAPIWIIRKLLGKLDNVVELKIRVLPLSATLIFIVSILLISIGQADINNLGNPTFWSVGYWFTSLLFGVLSAISILFAAFTFSKRTEIGIPVWTHSMMLAVALMLLTSYWGYYGLLGLRTWAN
jgi:CubicO group peptidase (beta-lactamase class C family)